MNEICLPTRFRDSEGWTKDGKKLSQSRFSMHIYQHENHMTNTANMATEHNYTIHEFA